MRLLKPQEALQDSPLLEQLPEEAAERLRHAAQVREYRRREFVYQEGDVIPGPGWVHKGLIRAYQTCADGRELTVAIAWPGDIATPTLSRREEWPVAAVAMTPLVRAVVAQEVLDEVCRRDHRVAMTLLRMLAEQQYERLRWQAWLMSVPLRRRLPRLLRRMAEALGTPTHGGILLDFPVVQEDVAVIAHVTRDETGRVMREMVREGVIKRVPGRRLLIPDPGRLKA